MFETREGYGEQEARYRDNGRHYVINIYHLDRGRLN